MVEWRPHAAPHLLGDELSTSLSVKKQYSSKRQNQNEGHVGVQTVDCLVADKWLNEQSTKAWDD